MVDDFISNIKTFKDFSVMEFKGKYFDGDRQTQ